MFSTSPLISSRLVAICILGDLEDVTKWIVWVKSSRDIHNISKVIHNILLQIFCAFSALTLLVRQQEEHQSHKKLSDEVLV